MTDITLFDNTRENAVHLRIDPEFKALIRPQTQEEHDLLEQQLLADGCISPIVVWGDTILDGHNRFSLCKKHEIPFETIEVYGIEDRDDAIIWIIDHQLARRNLIPFDRTTIALIKKPLVEAKAKAKQKAGGEVRQKSDEPGMRTDETVAKEAGVSKDTVRKVEAIQENATEEVVAAVKSGDISINKAAEVAAQPKEKQAAALAKAKEKKPRKPKQPKAEKQTTENPAVEPAQMTVPLAQFAELQEKYDALLEEHGNLLDSHKDLANEVEILQPFKDGTEAQTMRQLRAELDQAKRSCGDFMNQSAERQSQINYWKRRAEKAERALVA